jgi:hypothetical protein
MALSPEEALHRKKARDAMYQDACKQTAWSLLHLLRRRWGTLEKKLDVWQVAFTEPPPKEKLR